MEDFNYEDFSWDMVKSESKALAGYIAEKIPMEFTFLDGEILIGTIKWFDEMSLGILNDSQEEIYIDKRYLKWFKPLIKS